MGLKSTANGEAPVLPGEDYPLRREAERALAAAATPPAGWQPTGLGRRDYLALIGSICRYFRPYQEERGAILDPFAGEEKQYATPCYALSAGLVALRGRAGAGPWGAGTLRSVPNADSGSPNRADAKPDADLLASAVRAQEHALRSLAVDKNTAQNHADFFAPLVVLTYHLLEPHVAPEQARRWGEWLRSIDPETTYRDTFSAKRQAGQPLAVHNWNVVAVAGELLRGLSERTRNRHSQPWAAQYLDYQLREHAELSWGLYRDPNTPLPYDLFPRHHLGYALAAGALDRLAPALRDRVADWLHRGEWTSALTQTGSGGIPPGWRSSEHLWNDAALVALAEVAARRYAEAGERVAAGLFRRVASLAFRDALHWQRPTGELHVVKNHFEPAERFGFAGYSFHSNYGLYPAAMLAIAVLFGDGETPEAPAPVETATTVIRYPDPFHRLVAVSRGLTLTFDLDSDGHYDVTGLNSVRRAGAHPLLGPATGVPAYPRYHVPEPAQRAAGIGLTWPAPDGVEASLAGLRTKRVTLEVERQGDSEVVFTLRYELESAGCSAVIGRYSLTPDGVDGEERAEGVDGEGFGFAWLYLVDDGRDRSQIAVEGDTLRVELGESTQRVRVENGAWVVDNRRLAHRSGWAGVARVTGLAQPVRWHLRYS